MSEGNVTNLKEVKKKNKKPEQTDEMKMRQAVTRKELIEVLQQVTTSVQEMSQFLMDDMNTLYAQHLFPNEIKMSVLEKILIDKGLTTEEEVLTLYTGKIEEMNKQAQEIKAKNEAETEAGKIIEESVKTEEE